MADSPHDSHPSAASEPPRRRGRGLLGGLMRLGGLLAFALFLFVIGFYTGLIVLSQGGGPTASTYREGRGGKKIAILPIRGMIGGDTTAFARRAVQAILKDDSIAAVVLRVESPGGGATASDEIHHELMRLREEGGLPVIASYGNYAASGGYFVSCFADRIFAQPTTITGSIGVIAPFFTIHEMLDKIGVEPKIMTSTAATKKDLGSMFRPWTEEDRQEVRKLLDAIQQRFVSVVAEGRSDVLTREEVVAAANGAGLMAGEALEAGLIDEIGFIDAALAHAGRAAGLEHPDRAPAVIYQPRASLGDLVGLRAGAAGGGEASIRIDSAAVRSWLQDLSVPRMMYLFRP